MSEVGHLGDSVIKEESYEEVASGEPEKYLNSNKEDKGGTVKDNIPKIGPKVKLLLRDTDKWQTATVYSLATEKYCEWHNVEYEDGHILPIDWRKEVQSWYVEDGDEGEQSVLKCSDNKDLEKGTEINSTFNGL